jgi:hypothetical protein
LINTSRLYHLVLLKALGTNQNKYDFANFSCFCVFNKQLYLENAV